MNTNQSHPAMKPVLVNQISDDIRDLKSSDVKLQRTVFTGRALADIFAGDTIVNSGKDAAYFTDDKIDFDKITDPGCRFIPANSMVNGPDFAVATVDSSGSKTKLGGFLYTMTVLPSGELEWSYKGVDTPRSGIIETIKDPEGDENLDGVPNGNTVARPIATGTPIRQLYYTSNTDLGDHDAYTRIGQYVERTNPDTGNVYYQWDWGDWQAINGQKQYIVVTDADMAEVVNPIINAVYSVHTCVDSFRLPDPNQYKYGETITIIQHPDPNTVERTLYSTNVVYESYDQEEFLEGGGINPLFERMQVTCTPSPKRNTTAENGAFTDYLVPTEYVFEIAPRIEGSTNDKTWHLKINADETEFTSGIAEMVDTHTTLGVNDILDYKNRKFGPSYAVLDNEDFLLNRTFPVQGRILIQLSRSGALIDEDWRITVKRIKSTTPTSFIPTEDTTPDENKYYFMRKTKVTVTEDEEYVEATFSEVYDEHGKVIDYTFTPGVQYYELDMINIADAEVILIAGRNVTEDPAEPWKKSIEDASRVVYRNAEVLRNDVVLVTVEPGGHGHAANMEGVNPVIRFVPDPHPTSYTGRDEVNPSAFTANQLEKLAEEQKVRPETPADQLPASTAALIEAVKYLGGKAQARGLLVGSPEVGSVNSMTETGFYHISADSVDVALPQMLGYDTTIEGQLLVHGNVLAAANVITEDDGVITTTGTATQFLTQVANGRTNVWIRMSYAEGSSYVWTPWRTVGSDTHLVDWTDQDLSYSIDQVKQALAGGKAVIRCGITNVVYPADITAVTQNIELPPPDFYPTGTEIELVVYGRFYRTTTGGAPISTRISLVYTPTDSIYPRGLVLNPFDQYQDTNDTSIYSFRYTLRPGRTGWTFERAQLNEF